MPPQMVALKDEAARLRAAVDEEWNKAIEAADAVIRNRGSGNDANEANMNRNAVRGLKRGDDVKGVK